MDDQDRADALIAFRQQEGIDRVKRNQASSRWRWVDCVDCGDELIPFRRDNGYSRCVDCQFDVENHIDI